MVYLITYNYSDALNIMDTEKLPANKTRYVTDIGKLHDLEPSDVVVLCPGWKSRKDAETVNVILEYTKAQIIVHE